MSNDGGKTQKPPSSQGDKKPQQAPQGESAREPEGRGLRAGAGFQAVLDQRQRAVEEVRYRTTGGASGIAPAGHLAAQRRDIIGGAAARLMRKPSGPAAGGQIPKTTGSPLGADVRGKMEGKLGADLSGVKVHTGGESAKAASDFGARAFTVGSDVHFNAGQFAPGTKEGDRLLAHELTHVVQGQKSGIQRKADEEKQDEGEGGPEVSQPHEPAEQEADAVGDQVADDLHAAGDKDKKKDKKSAKGDDEKKTGEGEAAGQEEPAKADKGAEAKPAATISAKLEGVGRKIFLTSSGGNPPPRPPASGNGPGQEAKPTDPAALASQLPRESYTEVGGQVTPLSIEVAGQTAQVKAGGTDVATKSDSQHPFKVAADLKADVEAYLKATPEAQPALLAKIKAGMKALATAMAKARGEDIPIIALRSTFEKAIGQKAFAGTDGFAGAEAAVNAMTNSALQTVLASKGQAMAAASTIQDKLATLSADPELKTAIEGIGIKINIGFAGSVGGSFDTIAKALTSGSLTQRCVHLINFGDKFLRPQLVAGTTGVLDQIKANLSSPDFAELEEKLKVLRAAQKQGVQDKKTEKAVFSEEQFSAKVEGGGAMDMKTPEVPLEALDRAALFRLAKQLGVQATSKMPNTEILDLIKAKRANDPKASPTSNADQMTMPDQKQITQKGMPYIEGIKANIVKPDHQWIADATAAEMPLKAGISGTTHRFLGLGGLLGVGDKGGMRLAMLGHLQAIEAHSFWEICDAAGMGPPAGRYVPFPPVADAAMENAAKEVLSKDGAFAQTATGQNDMGLQTKRLLGTDK